LIWLGICIALWIYHAITHQDVKIAFYMASGGWLASWWLDSED